MLVNTWLTGRTSGDVDRTTLRWFVGGGLAPDVPLHVLAAGSLVWYAVAQGMTPPETFEHVFGTMFFEDPVWKAANSALHAPLVLAALAVAGGAAGGPRGRHIRALAAGAAIHAVVDVLTHHSDGPLLWFPVDWSYRFASPVSYWEPEHFGRPMSVLDLGLTVGLGLWAVRRWRRHGVVLGQVPAEATAPLPADERRPEVLP